MVMLLNECFERAVSNLALPNEVSTRLRFGKDIANDERPRASHRGRSQGGSKTADPAIRRQLLNGMNQRAARRLVAKISMARLTSALMPFLASATMSWKKIFSPSALVAR